MPSYILRDVDERLWERLQDRCAGDDLTIRDALIGLIDGYVAGRVEVTRTLTSNPAHKSKRR